MATPSIVLVPDRYKAAKLYSQIPDSGAVDFDVTRATTAYRTNASGILESVASGVPRLDYPAAGGCPSLLVEPAATNLVLRSEEFNNASWTKANLAVSGNLTTAPDGTLTADRIIDDTAASTTHRVYSNVYSVVSGTTYSASCFVKAGTSNRVEISIRSNIEGIIGIVPTVFDLAAGTIISGSGRIEDYGNGWYRCTNTGTSTFTGSSSVFIYLYNSANQALYTGTASNTLFLWGAQLETGSVATSYIPTVAATATRNADVISKTGVSGFIGQTEGTIYAEVDLRQNKTSFSNLIGIRDSAVSNQDIRLFQRGLDGGALANRIALQIRIANVVVASIESSAISAGLHKIAYAYQAGNFALYIDGVQIGTSSDATALSWNLNDIFIGASQAGTTPLNDRIRAAAIYTTRLSNSELAALTSL
jgi:hypothetical protein